MAKIEKMQRKFTKTGNYEQRQGLIARLLDYFRRQMQEPGQVQLLETHISWILLAGEFAYKIKKPVNLQFLDFTTLQSRKHYCEEEIRLNRRLSGDLYIGVIEIGGSLQQPIPETGPALEYAVKLRRFPVAQQLDVMAANQQLLPQHVDSLASLLANFHLSLDAASKSQDWGSAGRLLDATEQNFSQLGSLLGGQMNGDLLAELHKKSLQAYRRCAMLVDQRKQQGFVRECHGDLHLGNIVLLEKHPVPFDAIEFNAAFRWIDVMDEVAFTMMDMLFHGLYSLAWRFLNRYLEITGDYAGLQLLQMYLSFRATVRAKVAAIHAAQQGVPVKEAQRARQDCREYLQLAQQCLVPGKPALIITHGLPGSGKSTIAQLAAEQLGAIRLRSDVERKRLFGLGALEKSREATGRDLYTGDISLQTYDRLLFLADVLLKAGFIVIVDAAFLRQAERARFCRLAEDMQASFVIASITTKPDVLRERLKTRQLQQLDASEADIHVLEKLQQTADLLTESEEKVSVTFENGEQGIASCNASWEALHKRL